MVQGSTLEDKRTALEAFPDKIRVMTCEPSAGQVGCEVFDNRIDFYMELARLESRSNFKFFTGNTGRMAVNYARELMANQAIDQGMDYVLMIDDDQIVPKNMFERLYKTAQEHKADIVSPMVTQRVPPFHPVMWKHSWTDTDKGRAVNNEFISDYEPNSVVVCDAVGFGVVLIKVDLIRKIKAPRFFSNTHLGEDIFFCIKARGEAGAKIVMDTAIKVGHMRSPEMATEWDYIKANKLEEKFDKVYGPIKRKMESIDVLNDTISAK